MISIRFFLQTLKYSFIKILILVLIISIGCSEKDDKETIVDNDNDTGNTDQATFTDLRDGQIYNIVEIGEQMWFAENLNYNTGNSWCYDDEPSNCETYGRLYDWQTAIIACPEGWHLPSDEEWIILINFLGGEDVAGGSMIGEIGWLNSSNSIGKNSSGFTGLPGGYRLFFGDYTNISISGHWWTSSEDNHNEIVARFRSLNNLPDISNNIGTNVIGKSLGLSCRCLKD
jgi:uncharacterized protein (TIGR02145 family)